ncbi:MAG TPA: DUF3068 domain-containing protein [Nocardioides sp.]
MRKIGVWALLGVGAFLLVAALVARLWGYPAAQRTPLDTNSTTLLSGEASGVVVQVGDGEPQPVVGVNRTLADADRSTDDAIVFGAYTCVAVDQDLAGPEDYCLPGEDERIVTITTPSEGVTGAPDAFATDRRTAEALENDGLVPDGYEQKVGLINKWPFQVEEKAYDVWDDVLGETVEAEFVGTEDVEGFETYKFEYTVTDVPTEIAAGTDGTYSQHKVYWIDPTTGAIIKQTQEETRVTESGDVALDMAIGYTDETVQDNVETAESNGRMLALIGTWIPIVGGILGVAAILTSVLLMTGGGRRRAPGHSSGSEQTSTLSLDK